MQMLRPDNMVGSQGAHVGADRHCLLNPEFRFRLIEARHAADGAGGENSEASTNINAPRESATRDQMTTTGTNNPYEHNSIHVGHHDSVGAGVR
jgi:hypothetical protein